MDALETERYSVRCVLSRPPRSETSAESKRCNSSRLQNPAMNLADPTGLARESRTQLFDVLCHLRRLFNKKTQRHEDGTLGQMCERCLSWWYLLLHLWRRAACNRTLAWQIGMCLVFISTPFLVRTSGCAERSCLVCCGPLKASTTIPFRWTPVRRSSVTQLHPVMGDHDCLG